MNEKINVGQDMFSVIGMDTEIAVNKILEHALVTRAQKEVYYQPYQSCDYVTYTKTLGSQRVNLELLYPYAQVGEGAFVDFYIACAGEEEIYLNVSNDVKVWYNRELIYEEDIHNHAQEKVEEMVHLPICVKEHAVNEVRILCKKNIIKEFGFEFLLSVKRYPTMWANDYLFYARNIFPMKERAGEEGLAISTLISSEELRKIEGQYPTVSYVWPTPLLKEDTFDFNKLCEEGDVCYVYTEVSSNHILKCQGTIDKVFIKKGETEKWKLVVNEYQTKIDIPVQKGEKLLFCCRKKGNEWSLNLNTKHLKLPFLKTAREYGVQAIFVGPFLGDKSHAPEFEWDFSKVFLNEKGMKCYWRFCDGSELRIYLDSIFFGQWFYALMVGFYGIRDAANILGDTARQRLFCKNMSMLARYFDYIEYDIKEHVMPAFMPRVYEMNVLDNIGTMGMNLIDAYLDSNDRTLLPLIERIKYQVEETIPRFADGTYNRTSSMWADDLYMSCPFLVRMGRLTSDNSWYLKAAKQIQGFKERLYMEEEHVFSHIYFPKKGVANRVPWGRGNGWVMWTLSEFLMYAEGHIDVSAEKKLFYDMAHGIRVLQSENGMWRQVLDRMDEGSYLETSCTGMFLLAFTRGVKYGWLEEDFMDCMEKAWKGLLTYSIDHTGNVYGVCMGSGCAMEAEYYFTIPTIINDDHGTGVVLAAGAEYSALLRELENKSTTIMRV